MGNKILRQRLKGPALASYYPQKTVTVKDVKREFGPDLTTFDEKEEDRLEHILEYVYVLTAIWRMVTNIGISLKARGKSAPKKKKGGKSRFQVEVPCALKLTPL